MQTRSSRTGLAPVWLAALALALPSVSQAQQSLATRVGNVLENGICGQVSDAVLASSACVQSAGGISAAETAEVSVALSGNSAAAAGSNASQTTIAQVDQQTERLSAVRDGSAGEEVGDLGGFLNAFGGWGDTRLRGEEPGFDYHGGGFTLGIDQRVGDDKVVGFGFGWNRQTNEYDSAASVTTGGGNVGGGELEADSYVMSLYGSWYDGPLYVDGMFSYTFVDYEIQRSVNAAFFGQSGGVSAETDAHQVGITLGTGYQFQVAGVNVGPLAQMNYLHTRIDSYNESGFASFALGYAKQKVHSLITSIGGEVSAPISLDFGVLTPHARITWEHEFKDDPRSIDARFLLDDSGNGNVISTVTESPDRNYARLGVGAAAQLQDGISAFVDYETLLGLRGVDAHKITAGGRIEF